MIYDWLIIVSLSYIADSREECCANFIIVKRATREQEILMMLMIIYAANNELRNSVIVYLYNIIRVFQNRLLHFLVIY